MLRGEQAVQICLLSRAALEVDHDSLKWKLGFHRAAIEFGSCQRIPVALKDNSPAAFSGYREAVPLRHRRRNSGQTESDNQAQSNFAKPRRKRLVVSCPSQKTGIWIFRHVYSHRTGRRKFEEYNSSAAPVNRRE